MKITYDENTKDVKYSEIDLGGTFLAFGEVFIKTNEMGVSGVRCVKLSTGEIYSYKPEYKVTPVEARVVLTK